MNNTLPFKNGENTVSYRFGLLVYACLIQAGSLLTASFPSLTLYFPPRSVHYKRDEICSLGPCLLGAAQLNELRTSGFFFPLHILVRHSGVQ